MNKLNNKEEKIKDILGGLEIDIDTNDIWSNIEAELPQPKKKRRFGFFLLFGIIILGSIGIAWNTLASDKNNIATQNIETTTTTNNKMIVDNSNTSSENVASTIENEIQENKVNTQTEPTTIKIKSNISQQSNVELSIPTINKDIPLTKSILTEINPTDLNNSKILATNQIVKSQPIISQLENQLTKLELTSPKTLRKSITEVDLAPTLSSQLFDIAERLQIETLPKEIKPLSSFGRQLLLQFKIGANQNFTSISNINNVSEFDASEFGFERDRLGLSGSLAIGVENNGWRWLAGIAYHQNVSTYERDDITIEKDLVSGIESYRISTDGVVTSQNGTTTITSARDNNISFHRQHQAIDFHATIGKRLWSYKGLVIMADIGLGINTFTKTTGYYLADKAFGFTKISDDNHPYRVNTHWNAITSLEIGYDFGKTRIGLSPFIRYNPNSITEQTHFYQLKNSQVGMQLSLTYSPTRE